jgi:hypothetical protein
MVHSPQGNQPGAGKFVGGLGSQPRGEPETRRPPRRRIGILSPPSSLAPGRAVTAANALLRDLHALGVEVWPAADMIRFRPDDRVTPELRARMLAHKSEILRALRIQELARIVYGPAPAGSPEVLLRAALLSRQIHQAAGPGCPVIDFGDDRPEQATRQARQGGSGAPPGWPAHRFDVAAAVASSAASR